MAKYAVFYGEPEDREAMIDWTDPVEDGDFAEYVVELTEVEVQEYRNIRVLLTDFWRKHRIEDVG